MRPRVAVFRPDDERLAAAVERLEALGAGPVADPLLAVDPTGATPRDDADYLILTSRTGVELVPEGFPVGDMTICAIGERTAAALEAAGIDPDLVPETYSSRGLLAALGHDVAGARVEVARSDHGSAVLLEGLGDRGAYHHESVLYRLVRPPGSGESAAMAAAGELDAVLFTSSLTVEHFLVAAAERGVHDEAVDGLGNTVVGAIGEPTRETAASHGIAVDVVPETATFDALAEAVLARIAP